MPETDEQLIARTHSGDREAFCLLVERYQRPALAVAAAILRCRHDAQDAVQESFVAAFCQLNRLWSAHKFGAWLLKIVRRQALQQLRARASRPQVVAVGIEPQQDEPRNAELSEVFSLIARLPRQECVVVSLRHLEEMPVAQIAHVTGRPEGTVTKQLSRAYARLRAMLKEQE